VTALTPNEALGRAGENIPEDVISIVNKLLMENLRVNISNDRKYLSSNVLQNDIVDRIVEATMVPSEAIFKKRWMDFEPVFRRAGWKVVYDRPGYNETYEANFTFTAEVLDK